jgi:hypothetical protein
LEGHDQRQYSENERGIIEKDREVKVGDIVRQNNSLIEMKRKGKIESASNMIGVVVEIRNQGLPVEEKENEWLKGWMDHLGRQVDVMWSNGTLSTNFAENSLEVVYDE